MAMQNFTPGEQAEINGDRRILDPGLIAKIRSTRVPQPFMLYDSINIGDGQNDISRGWYNTWAGFGRAQMLKFFEGRDPNTDSAYVNITTPTADFAYEIKMISIEFWAPTGYSDRDTDANDTEFVPDLWTRQVPFQSSVNILTQNGADQLIQIPCVHAPGGSGQSQPQLGAAATPQYIPGTNGTAQFSNRFVMQNAYMLPAKASMQAELQISSPVREVLQTIAGPGFTQYTNGAGQTVEMPKVYTVRIGLLGMRYLQIRGVRAA